jgi:Domain of unknown function (DUF4411)
MPYLLDANVFIQAKNLHYGFDFCPGFWDWLDQAHGTGTVSSVSHVGDELIAGTDALADWAKARATAFFREPDAKSLPELANVSQWVVGQRYEPAAVNTFLQVADYYLVAYAKAHGFTVVTHELPADSTRKIKIPNVCVGLGVPYVNVFQMLSRERVRLVLGQAPADSSQPLK